MDKGVKPSSGSSTGSPSAEGAALLLISTLVSSIAEKFKKVDEYISKLEQNQEKREKLLKDQKKLLDQFMSRDYDGPRPNPDTGESLPLMEERAKYKQRERSLVGVEEGKKCTCDDVTISVLYANLRSMNPKSEISSALEKKLKFRTLIEKCKPNIVAVVETWLMSHHKDNQVKEEWGLEDYKIFRFDRADNVIPGTTDKSQDSAWKGGGILVGYRRDYRTQFEFSPEKIEDRITNCNDNLQGFAISRNFKCSKCTPEKTLSHSFRVIYRRPSALQKQDNEDFKVWDNSLISLIVDYYRGSGGFFKGKYSKGVAVGDFNMNNVNDQLGNAIVGYAPDIKRIDLKSPTTIRGTSPDAIFSTPDFVKTAHVLPFISDHAALFFTLKLGKDVPPPPYQFCKACNA